MSVFGMGAPQNFINQYQSMYQPTFQAAQTQYRDVLSGYQNLLGQQQQGQAAVAAGYPALSQQVLGSIQGIGASQAQQIQDVYAQQSGAATQGLINKGLGNTTVQNSVQRGLTLDAQKAQIALSNQIAQLTAGYQANIGLAGLGYRGQALAGNAQLGANLLGAASRVNFPQPNAGPYGAAIGAGGRNPYMGGGTSVNNPMSGMSGYGGGYNEGAGPGGPGGYGGMGFSPSAGGNPYMANQAPGQWGGSNYAIGSTSGGWEDAAYQQLPGTSGYAQSSGDFSAPAAQSPVAQEPAPVEDTSYAAPQQDYYTSDYSAPVDTSYADNSGGYDYSDYA